MWRDLIKSVGNDVWGKAYQIVVKRLRMATVENLDTQVKKSIMDSLFTKNPTHEWDIGDTEVIEPFKTEELTKACQRLRGREVPGVDGIPEEILKITSLARSNMYLEVFNKLLKNGIFPMEWKQARIILTRKPGKKNIGSTRFRQLCLLNTLGKFYEILLINTIIKRYLYVNNKLSSKQYGFRESKSTIMA